MASTSTSVVGFAAVLLAAIVFGASGQPPARPPRVRPMRVALLGAVAAALAFVALWVARPGRPADDRERAAGGRAAAPGTAGSVAKGSGAGGRASTGAGATRVPGADASLTLRDGDAEVLLLADGGIRGLDVLSASDRSAIARTLTSGRLDIPAEIDRLAAPRGALRSTSGDDFAGRGLRVWSPLATAVPAPQPTFRWTTIPAASAYRVLVVDANLNPVIESPWIAASQWTPADALPAGRVLHWQVEARTPQGIVRAPVPPAPDARIVILRDAERQALTQALDAAKGSDLARAVALARVGVLDDADAALARLADANRHSEAIARLRRHLAERRFPQ